MVIERLTDNNAIFVKQLACKEKQENASVLK